MTEHDNVKYVNSPIFDTKIDELKRQMAIAYAHIAELEANQMKNHEELKARAESVLEAWLADFMARLAIVEDKLSEA